MYFKTSKRTIIKTYFEINKYPEVIICLKFRIRLGSIHSYKTKQQKFTFKFSILRSLNENSEKRNELTKARDYTDKMEDKPLKDFGRRYI